MKILVMITSILLIATSGVVRSDSTDKTCDLSAHYAGLGYIDAKNKTDVRNRIQEIEHRADNDSYRKAMIGGMMNGRILYEKYPTLNQSEVENLSREECKFNS